MIQEHEIPRTTEDTDLKERIAIEAAQVEIDEKDRDVNGNLLAFPDGPQSHLSENYWRIVRTPSFKKWFGDWQGQDGEHSQVLDENGEPMLVYHESKNDFDAFSDEYIGSSTDDGYYGRGHYFSTNQGIAGFYSGEKQNVFLCFLNIRNPYRFDDENGETLFLRYLLNAPDKKTAIQNATNYLDISGIEKHIDDLQRGKVIRHRDIPNGVDFDQYWEQKILASLEHSRQLLDRVMEIVENLPQIYEEVNSKYDGVLCIGDGEKLNYKHYTELVAFRATQVFIAQKK